MQSVSRIVPRKPEPIALRFWYFKVIWGEFAVTVEGYRAKDEGESELFNWRSTPVMKRITSRKLVTRSGTTYVLQGTIDECSLLALGYPRLLCNQFRDGFPLDWCEILRQFHSTLMTKRLPRTTQWFDTSIVCGLKNSLAHSSTTSGEGMPSDVPSETTINRNRLSTVVPRHEFRDVNDATEQNDAERQPQQEAHSQKMNVLKDGRQNPKERMSQTSVDKNGENALFKMPSIPAVTKRLPIMKLYNWTLLFSVYDHGVSELFDDFGLVIEGFNEEQKSEWKTSCILAVNEAHHLQTASTIYKLVGPINTVAAAQQGYPKEFVANFLNGFPENWHTIISEFFKNYVKPHIELEECRMSAARTGRVDRINETDSDQDAWSDGDANGNSSTDQMEDSDSTAILPLSSKGTQKAEDKPSTSNKITKKLTPESDTRQRSKNKKETRGRKSLKTRSLEPLSDDRRPSKKPTKRVTLAGDQLRRSGRFIK
ncbi:unnamed protein product [Anisakis simplex]|uniref:SANTA domain-containing protein n=1 Tax=Anisakis simplex TaxID=6269 RepID=A0A0M3KAR8_ANISI|nr:unnamed protein product [Anisakis simplex]